MGLSEGRMREIAAGNDWIATLTAPNIEHLQDWGKLPPVVAWLMGTQKYLQFLATFRSILAPEAYCPFCREPPDHVCVHAREKDWALQDNPFPQDWAARHLLIVPRRHITDPFIEMGAEDWAAAGVLAKFAQERLGFPGGGFMMRVGNPIFNSGTVAHVSAHLMCPKLDREGRFPLSKALDQRQVNYIRFLEFRDQLLGQAEHNPDNALLLLFQET